MSYGGWLALAALLTACGADSGAASQSSCPTPIPAGCRCVAETLDCSARDDGTPPNPAAPNARPGMTANRAGAGGATGVAGATGTAADGLSAVDAATGAAAEPVRDAGPSAPVAEEAPDGGHAAARPDASPDDSEGVADGGTDAGNGARNDAGPSPGASGIVAEHGALRVDANRVVGRHGQPVQLRGMSWFWSQWTDFYVPQNVDVMVDDWQATLVRAALGVENEGGYLQDPGANVAKVRVLVDRAIERDVYVIIDWHDHHAQDHMAQATAFFEDMARAYGDYPHVIFEVYNEPVDVSWPVVKSYAEEMIETIRSAGSENLIIVGTPTWSQDVDIAAEDPITSDDNVAYTLHFYANTHKQFLRDKAETALDRGIALFATEWGTCSADGNGSINEAETRTWLDFLRAHSISWANWSLNDKDEACSAIHPAGGSVGPWRDDQLTPSGRLIKQAIP